MIVRLALALGLVGAGAILPTALPAQTFQIDENRIIGCYIETQTGAASRPDHCVGQAANQCQDTPEGSTTHGIAMCLKAETVVWDRFLNARFQEARDHMFALGGEEAQISLRDAQRAWIAFRDAECALQYDRAGGGTIRSINYAQCMMEMTATRAVELSKIGTGQ